MDPIKPAGHVRHRDVPAASPASQAAATPGPVPQGAGAGGRLGRAAALSVLTSPPAQPPVDEAAGVAAAAAANAFRLRTLWRSFSRELAFEVMADRVAVIEVIDTATGEVIRTLAPAEQQRLLRALERGDASLLFDGGP